LIYLSNAEISKIDETMLSIVIRQGATATVKEKQTQTTIAQYQQNISN